MILVDMALLCKMFVLYKEIKFKPNKKRPMLTFMLSLQTEITSIDADQPSHPVRVYTVRKSNGHFTSMKSD